MSQADQVRQALDWYRDHVRELLAKLVPKRLAEFDRDVKRIEALQGQIGGECAVCFVGHSGVGKSTLINALVDDARAVLPQGGVGPLTAQATSVRWADAPRFEATYLPPGRLNQLLFSLERYHERRSSGSVKEPATDEPLDLDPKDRDEAERDARDAAEEADEGDRRIDALVRQACLLVRGASDAEIESTYLTDCLRAALGQDARHGHEPNEGDAPRVESLRRALRLAKNGHAYRREGVLKDRDFIDDLRRHAAGHIAPLIKTLDVGWNSRTLADGLTLVDLPGLGIANDQYRDVTQEWTREKARAIALVVDRAGITQESADLLHGSGFLGRLLHAADDPSADPVQLLVVAVKLDLTADDEWRSEKDYDPDDARPWTAHFKAVQQQMQKRLGSEVRKQIVGALRKSASDQADLEVDRVAERLMSDLAVHVVSAPQFRRLARQDRDDPPRIREPEESGVPQLRGRLQALSADRDALLNKRMATAANQFVERIFGTLQVVAQGGDGARKRDDNERIRAELNSFLFGSSGPGTQLRARQGAFREFLSQTGAQRIQDTVENAGHTAEKSIRQYLNDLGVAHWATLRAAVRRGGAFIGARRIDLPNEFAIRVDAPVGLTWSKNILAAVRKRTRQLGQEYVRFVDQVVEWVTREKAARTSTKRIEAVQKQTRADVAALDTMRGEQLDELRRRVRQQLLERIGGAIREECSRFVEGGRDVGRGTKRRILDLFDDLVPMVMKAAGDTAVEVMRSNYQMVERDIRDVFEASLDPIESVSEAIAPTRPVDPAERELLTRIDAIVGAAPSRTVSASEGQ